MRYILILLLLPLLATSQNDDTTKYSKYPNTYGIQYPRLLATKVLRVPTDTSNSKTGIAIYGNTLFYGNGIYWASPSAAGVDTTSLSNRINLRVKYTDTSAMLTAYRTALNSKVRYIDSSVTFITPTYFNSNKGIQKTDLSATTPMTFNTSTGVIAIGQSTTSTNGYLSSTDWNTFNGKVPYTGANSDLEMGAYSVNAASFKVNGTGGNGHVDLKWQSADAPSISNSTALYADASGNLKWKNDGNYTTTISSSANNTNITITAPNRNVKIDSITTSTTTAISGLLKGSGGTVGAATSGAANDYLVGGSLSATRNVSTGSVFTYNSATGAYNLDTTKLLTGAGVPSGQLMPFSLWSSANSKLSSSTVTYGNYDSTNHNFNFGTTATQSTFLVNIAGQLRIINSGAGNGFIFRDVVGANTYNAIYNSNSTPTSSNYIFASDGTNTNFNATGYVQFINNGVVTIRTTASNRVLINTTSDDNTNTLQVNGNAKATQYRLSALNTAPASASDTGTTGEIRITASYIYICTATNTWVRAALATW